MVSLLTEANRGQAREVEAGHRTQQCHSEQPKKHFFTEVISFSQNGPNNGNLLGIIDFHIGHPQPILQLGRHVTSRKPLFVAQSILGNGMGLSL